MNHKVSYGEYMLRIKLFDGFGSWLRGKFDILYVDLIAVRGGGIDISHLSCALPDILQLKFMGK